MKKIVHKLFSIVISFMMISSLVIPAYSTSIRGNLIVYFTNSDAEVETVAELNRLNSNTQIVKFDYDFFEHLKYRFIGNLYLVGHGSKKGIQSDNGLVSWNVINSLVEKIPAKFVSYVSCNSFDASQSISSSKRKIIIGFNGEIETILAARMASMYAAAISRNFVKFNQIYLLVRFRFQEIQKMTSYNTLPYFADEGGGSGGSGGSGLNCYTVSHWKSIASDRIPSSATEVDRGLAISGSYADLYLSNPNQFFWSGMASWVSELSAVGRETARQIQISGFADAAAILAGVAIITAAVLLIFAVSVLIAALIAILVVAFIYIIVYLIYGGWGIVQSTQAVSNLLTDVNEGIYNHAAWAHFAFMHGGYECIDELVTVSNTKGYTWFKEHFEQLENGNIVQGVINFFISEQREFAQPIYNQYDPQLISAIESQIKVTFGIQNGYNTEHIWKDDMPDGDLSNGQDRTDWSNMFLVPTFEEYAWKTSQTVDYMNEKILNGEEVGGSY